MHELISDTCRITDDSLIYRLYHYFVIPLQTVLCHSIPFRTVLYRSKPTYTVLCRSEPVLILQRTENRYRFPFRSGKKCAADTAPIPFQKIWYGSTSESSHCTAKRCKIAHIRLAIKQFQNTVVYDRISFIGTSSFII